MGCSSQQLCLMVKVVTCTAASNLCLHFSSGVKSLEEVCLQVTDLLPGLKKLRNLLPEHGCLLLSPGNFWQNDRERFNADPDIIKTIHQHEPKTLQTSATLKGKRLKCQRSPLSIGVKITGELSKPFCSSYSRYALAFFPCAIVYCIQRLPHCHREAFILLPLVLLLSFAFICPETTLDFMKVFLPS